MAAPASDVSSTEMISAVDSDLDRLVAHVLVEARQLVEKHGDFNPFGAVINQDGGLRAYTGIEFPDRQKIYLLMRAGFAKDAADGKIRATALVALANPPKEVAGGYPEAIAVTAEEPGRACRVYLPFKRARVLGVGPPRTSYGAQLSMDIDGFVFQAG